MPDKAKAKKKIHQPHDKIVKKILSDITIAQGVLSLYLPKEILKIVNLKKLDLQKDSFIDDEHRAYATDLLYKTTFQKEEGYIWILLEHQRKSDYWMPVRIFKYMGMIWDHIRKNTKSKSKKIPLIYPLVLYNGDKPYTESLTLSDLIAPEASKKIFSHLFTEPFQLIDLAAIPDETLRKQAQKQVGWAAFAMACKHAYDRNLAAFIDQKLGELLRSLDQAGDTDTVAEIIYYLCNENDYLEIGQIFAIIRRKFSPTVESKVMTIVQQLEAKGIKKGIQQGIERGIEQGIEQGIERGIEKGKEEVAKRLLSEHKDMNKADLMAWVSNVSGISIERVRELSKKH